MRQAVRQAIRSCAAHPSFTLMAVMMLALGIGTNATMFSIVNAVMLRPLPYQNDDRLVWVWALDTRRSVRQWASYPDFLDWQERSRTLELLTGWGSNELTLTGTDEPQRLRSAIVTGNFFQLLGVAPILGTTTRVAGIGAPDRQVVLSHALWERRFNAEPGLVGQSITLSGQRHTVVGIMPADFRFPIDAQPSDLWFLLGRDQFNPALRERRDARMFEVIGRVREGSTIDQAQAEMNVIAATLGREFPATNGEVGVQVVSAKDQIAGRFSDVLLLLFAAVGCVLLIACVNVANLLLARAAGRQRELAVRTALGAGRMRLAGQLFLESLPLAVAGGVFGGLLASWGVRALVPLIPSDLPRAGEIGIDIASLAFIVLASGVTGIAVSLAPLVSATRVNLVAAFQEGTPAASVGRGARSLSHVLVVGEIALAMILLAGAALFLNSFTRLSEPDPGFDPRNVLSFHVDWSSPKYSPTQAAVTFRELQARLHAIPGVRAASVGLQLPDRGAPVVDEALPLVEVEGRPIAVSQRQRTALLRTQPGYFQAMGIPLVGGRDFRDSDRPQTPPVTIINESLARAYFPNEDPVGKRLVLESWTFFGRRSHEIVGVAGDVKHRGLTTPPALLAYLPMAQFPSTGSDVVVRTANDPLTYVTAVRAAVRSIDPDQPIYDIQTVEQRVARTLAQDRFGTLLLSVFSFLAVMLAVGGLYGVLSYATAQRTREVGVRIAMGAASGDIVRLMLFQGMTLALTGVALGLAGALALGRIIGNFLFGVVPTDPLTLAVVATILTSIALLACWLPAWKATRVDPIVALRYQ